MDQDYAKLKKREKLLSIIINATIVLVSISIVIILISLI
jgi:hypothetical protein